MTSCSKPSAPINIDLTQINGKCDLKCQYSFEYVNSSCIATNRGNYISLSYDKTNNPPVIYNSIGYYVSDVRIYIPSLHSYNGTKGDGEFIIVHKTNTGDKPLLVCIPLMVSNIISTDTKLLKTIIEQISVSAPNEGEQTNININNYNLSDIVPNKPFYSYIASEPYTNCSNQKVNYIVYTPSDGYINIHSKSYDILKNIIKKQTYKINKNPPQLFFNMDGPTSRISSDNIYIDCQPVGHSDETIITPSSTYKDTQSEMFADFLKNPFNSQLFIIIISIFIGLILFIFIYMSLTFVRPQTQSINNTIEK